MSSNNTVRPRGRGRASFRSKYVTRSNLHVIATHVPAAPISTSKKKPITKNIKKATNLVSENSKSPSKSCFVSVGQDIKTSAVAKKDSGLPKSESGTAKTDLVSAKTESGLPKKDSVATKKEELQKSNSTTNIFFSSDTTRKERQASYAKSNFLMLQELDKITPKSKTARPKKVFTPQVEKIVRKTVTAPQNVDKTTKKFVNQDLKTKPGETKKVTPHDLKMKPSQSKVPPYQKFNKNKKDSVCLSFPKADKPIGKKKQFLNQNVTQQGKEMSYYEEDFTGRQVDKKKARLDASSNFEGHKRREPSFWEDGSNSGGAYFLSEQEEIASRKKPHSSRDYLRSLDEDMYYKNKYKKPKKKDSKWKESEPYPVYDKYSWYSKDYKLKQKYEEEHAFNEYSDYPLEEGDFEEVEDFEEVASVESKVPVHFRKCIVRYLNYRTFSYFRPKWYYISRKRYVVNCMYATGKNGKITAGKEKDTKRNEDRIMEENLKDSDMEVPEEECLDSFEMLEVIPDDDVITEDISVHDDETISDDVSVHDDEIISDDVSVHDDEIISDDVSVHDGSGEKDLSVAKKNDIKPAILNKEIEAHNETVKLSVSSKKVQAVQNIGNQTTQKKSLSPEKRNSIPVIDLCFDSPKAKKIVDSIATSDRGTLENPEIIVKNMEVHVINLEANDTVAKKSEGNSEKDNEMDLSIIKTSAREFLKCNSSLAFTTDFNQGVAAIQNTLANWKSHLIGLEYILEIRANVDEAVVKKYLCGLCDADIPVEEAAGQIVINHIISYKHMCNYMAKHFPSSDYKFSKSVRSYISEIVLRKCCEEINNKLGYHFMCIVKENYFQKQGDKVKEHLDGMKHFSETDINIDPIIILNCLESDIQKDIACLIDDVMSKILIDEEKNSFFTPKTIVSNLRRSNVKDKKKELSKIIENTVSRASQNALILLTPEHDPLQSSEVISIKTTLPELKTPEKLVTTSKPSRELQRSSNLLQIHVHDNSNINVEPNKQSLGATSSLTSVKKDPQQKNLQVKEKSNMESVTPVDPNVKNEDPDTDSSFKFNANNSPTFCEYRPQESASTPVPKTEGSENEAVRIVRIRTITNRSVKLKFDEEDDDTPVYLTDSNVRTKNENESLLAEKDPEFVNPDSIITGDTDTLQGEDISDNDFSDHDFAEVASTGVETSAYKSKSRIKQHTHQKGPHSKFCRKRIYRGKESSTDQDSALNDINVSGSVIPTVDRFKGKHFSTFVKRSDELSLDSSISTSSRRKRSPLRLSRSPSLEEFLRKLSRSPKRSKSPLRVPRVPYRKRGSPIRRHSRSPYRRYSRSPRKRHSRSPYRKRSRSPIRRRSRSPFRKRSRSPARKRSRSPIRKRSRSPFRRHSRSPRRRISRSPIRKRSRSPVWSASKGHSIHKSRSPYRKIGGRKISRSPERIPIKLPVRRFSKSPIRRSKSPSSTYHPHSRSPLRSDSRLSKDSQSYKTDSAYKYKKDSTRSSGSFESTPQSSNPHRRKESEVGREMNDLDEVSDEDESKYFNTTSDNPVYMEIIKKLPESARIMLVKVLQRFSITNINPNDPSFFELMKFVASHSTEIQRLMSQPSVFSEVNAPMHGNPVQSQESLVHQYLLSSMKGNLNVSLPGETFPSTSGQTSASADVRFQQPPMPSTSGLQFIPPSSGLPPNQFQPSVFQQLNSQPQYPMQNIQHPAPPQVHPQQIYGNPPVEQQQQPRFQPHKYQTPSPHKQATAPQKKVQSEVIFKDLKATVNKIFGGDDVLGRIGIKIPGFNDTSDQEKWGTNPPIVPKINPEPQTSFQSNRSGMNFHNINEAQIRASDNIPQNYSKVNEPYFEEISRSEPHVPPPDAKVAFCDVQRSSQRNLFPVVNNSDTMPNYGGGNSQMSVNDAKKSLAQRLAAVLVKVGMTDVPAYLLQEMLMKIGAFSLNPPQDISEEEIIGILRKLKYL